MRIRKQPLGDRNIVGARIEAKRKELGIKQIDLLTQLQIKGVELTASGLSKLEGQIRSVNDYELVAIAEVLDVTLNWLVGKEDSLNSSRHSFVRVAFFLYKKAEETSPLLNFYLRPPKISCSLNSLSQSLWLKPYFLLRIVFLSLAFCIVISSLP